MEIIWKTLRNSSHSKIARFTVAIGGAGGTVGIIGNWEWCMEILSKVFGIK